jgi:hypothetical protein
VTGNWSTSVTTAAGPNSGYGASPAADCQPGATHFLTVAFPRVVTEMTLHMLAYNLTRVIPNLQVRRSYRSQGRRPSGSVFGVNPSSRACAARPRPLGTI